MARAGAPFIAIIEDQTLLLEVGPAGYSSWQISDDSGAAATSPAAKDEVNAMGVQIGLTHVPWNAALTRDVASMFNSP